MKILLIDGHALFREGLHHVLHQLPDGVGEILEAGNLLEGLTLVTRCPDIGLVLLEINSPAGNGANSVKIFRQHCSHIPLMVVSSEEDRHIIKEALDHGANGFVCKSSTGSTLLNALRLTLAGSIYVPQQLLHNPALTGNDGNGGSHDRKSKRPEHGLTSRQVEVLGYLTKGLSNKEIAGITHLAEGTVKAHVAAVYQNLGVKRRVEAVQVAKRLGLAGRE